MKNTEVFPDGNYQEVGRSALRIGDTIRVRTERSFPDLGTVTEPVIFKGYHSMFNGQILVGVSNISHIITITEDTYILLREKPLPILPTKPGSVILIDLVDSDSPAYDVKLGSTAILVADGRWVTTNMFGNILAINPEIIRKWSPATVTEAGIPHEASKPTIAEDKIRAIKELLEDDVYNLTEAQYLITQIGRVIHK